MELYTGIDLHSNNNLVGIKNKQGKRLFSKRLPNDLEIILKTLSPYKSNIKEVVVESTYNWYWLVDGLMANNYPVVLANPGAMQQYNGLKHTDDKIEAFFLAELSRLEILPTGYIHPRESREIRDVLRRRLLFVGSRTSQYLSLKSSLSRYTGKNYSRNFIMNKLTPGLLSEILPKDQDIGFLLNRQLGLIRYLTQQVHDIESRVHDKIKLKPEFEKIKTVPGIGLILGLTIMLETGDINRFKKVGNYTSYSRCAKAEGFSNGKKKHDNNSKNGNKYLSWAFVEAAHGMITCCKPAMKYYQRKKSEVNGALASKALAAKISKAVYYILTKVSDFRMRISDLFFPRFYPI
jgi:transposase